MIKDKEGNVIGITRGEFLGLSISTIIAAGCTKLIDNAPMPFYPPEEMKAAMDRMIWHSPFLGDIERSIQENDIKIADEFQEGGSNFRVLTCDTSKIWVETFDGSVIQTDIAHEVNTLVNESTTRSKCDEAIMFQKKNENDQWDAVDLPGTVLQMYATWILTNPSGTPLLPCAPETGECIRQRSELIQAYLDPEANPEDVERILSNMTPDVKNLIEGALNRLQNYNPNFQPIPEGISPEDLMKVHLANYHAKETYGGNPDFLKEIAERTGTLHAIFMPKKTKDDKEAIKEFKRSFKEIPPKPRVFYATTKDIFGTHRKILVMHNELNEHDLFNYDLSIDPSYERSDYKPANCWQELDSTQNESVGNFFKLARVIIPESQIVEIHELRPEEVSYAIVANKVVGLGKWRVAPALFYLDRATNTEKVCLLEERIRDIFIPKQNQVQSWENWITKVDKISNDLLKGVRHIFGLGALSPKEALARYLKGSDSYDLGLSLAHMPDSLWLKNVWASMGMDAILTNANYTEKNMAVSLTKLPIYHLTGAKAQFFGAELGLEDSVEIGEFTPEGEKVYLEAGEFMPIAEVIRLKGEDYILLSANRDENGGLLTPLDTLRNDWIIDEIHSALAVKLSDALNGGILPLDFDNNILDAVKKIAKIAMITTASVAWIVAPEFAGAFVAVTGRMVQTKLLQFLSSLPSIR